MVVRTLTDLIDGSLSRSLSWSWSLSGSRTLSGSRSWSLSGSRTRSRSLSGSWSLSWSLSGSRTRSRSLSGSWSLSGSRPETVEMQLWDDVCRGDMAALAILMDRLQEGDFMLLETGKIWIIRSATWTYVGLVTESTAMGVTLAPGAWRVPYLTDEGTWLEHGKFLSGDEAYPTPGTTFIPSLWIGPSEIPCEAFLREMPKWKRTHQSQS